MLIIIKEIFKYYRKKLVLLLNDDGNHVRFYIYFYSTKYARKQNNYYDVSSYINCLL